MKELIVDSFAGGGGASLGIEQAIGRGPDIAINSVCPVMAKVLAGANYQPVKARRKAKVS